jgi:hypothetical protein
MVRQGALGLARGDLDNPKVSAQVKLAQITQWLEGQPTPKDSYPVATALRPGVKNSPSVGCC